MLATPVQLFLAALAGAVAGAVNAIAGGGTLITFPTLVAIGIPPIIANATSSVALWPGTLASMWGYRRVLTGAGAWAVRLAVPSVLGGMLGAILLLRTSEDRFEAIVPLLVLGATVLFMVQGPLGKWLRERKGPVGTPGTVPDGVGSSDATTAMLSPPAMSIVIFQLFVAVYGGYFGAGMGILMLAALGLVGLQNIHQMNGLKNWMATCINVAAVLIFAVSGIVNWPVALAMAVGAALGGYAGSGVAQRVPQRIVRRGIVAIGLASAIWLAVGRL